VHQNLELGTLFTISLRAGAIACSDALIGTVSDLLRCYLVVHFDGVSPVSSSLRATSVVRPTWKPADSLSGSVLAIEKSPSN